MRNKKKPSFRAIRGQCQAICLIALGKPEWLQSRKTLLVKKLNKDDYNDKIMIVSLGFCQKTVCVNLIKISRCKHHTDNENNTL